MTVSAIIPNYNGKRLLQKNLAMVLQALGTVEVIVVDDGSTDGSSAYLKKQFPRIKVIEKMTNSGFATTVNLGVKAASGEIVLLLNTDIIPQKGFLRPLTKHFQDKTVFAVGCMDESREGEQVVLRGRGVGAFRRGFLMHAKGNVDKTNTLWASGGSSAFRKKLWEELGGMDEIYNPFYWEDIDLSYRAWKAGYKVLFDPQSKVVHQHETGAIKTHFTKREITSIAYRNQFLFVWKNITDPVFLISHLLWVPIHMLQAIVRGDSCFLLGFSDALRLLPQLLMNRRQTKRFFKKSDHEILDMFAHE